MHPVTSRFAILMGSASLLTLTSALTAHAQEASRAETLQVTPQQFAQVQVAQNVAQAQMAQAGPEAVPEQVLVTGSLIHGTAAVGVPITNLGTQDFTQTGAVTIGDLFRTVPVANVAPGPSATNSNGHQERETRVNIRGLDATGPRSLLMIDGVRFPPQADGLCAIDPSIIPALALDRVDILADGASATYGSDAIAGVVNVILKRGFDGAVTLAHVQVPTDGGGVQYQASQLWGRTWQGGDITLTYEWTDEKAVTGNIHSKFTTNFLPWGLEDPFVSIAAAQPGVVSTGTPVVARTVTVGSSTPAPVLVAGTCTNCFSIPRGTGTNWSAAADVKGPSGASTISWASLMGHPGDSNFVDPMTEGWEQGAQQKNSFVMTVDQQLFPGVTFFGTGFYSNRRVEERLPSFGGGGLGTYLTTWKVPTTNPYYPAGAPAGLQVSYDLAHEVPPSIPAWEISERYQFGLNLDLPFTWNGQIYESRSYEDVGYIRHFISKSGVNAALAGATNPATGAPIPFLNVFCDPFAFQCNSPATLAYIGATQTQQARWAMEEKGAKFDGPLFDLPAGSVKAAVGGTYESDSVIGASGTTAGVAGNPPLNQFIASDSEPYHVWAFFAQVDVPVFGDNLNFPLMRKLDLEGSWRYDNYGGNPVLTGITRNPKLSFTWLVDEAVGATIRGSWGTSFRFANEGEFSNILSPVDQSANLPSSSQNATVACINGAATPGSTAAGLIAGGGAATACNTTPGGISYGGGPEPALRIFTNAQGQTVTREGGLALAPEKATNYSVGLEIAPTIDFLRGLDLQATWYSVKINGVLQGQLAAATTSGLSDPNQRFHFILPSDTGCPVADNSNPTACAPFQKMVLAAINDPNQGEGLTAADASNIYWINDSATANSGFIHVTGVDFNGSYDYDAGDIGAYNIGITGTYYLHRWVQQSAGGAIFDAFHQNNLASVNGLPQQGIETLPRFIYRARLGWSDGPFSATIFWNHQSHFFEQHTSTPPNVNLACTTMGGTLGGGSFPCAISNFSYIQPAWDTIDLSFGYSTGTIPANVYLQNLTLQLTVTNVMGRHASFEYGPNSTTRNPGGFNILQPDYGRVIGLTLIKNW